MKFKAQINVASADLGSKVIHCSDEFFAASERMLQSSDPVWIEDKFDDHGKWMDGWETRRRRDGQNDYCFIKLGKKSLINGFDIDTSHFTGNYAPGVSILGGCFTDDISEKEIIEGLDDSAWFDLLEPQSLNGDADNTYTSISQQGVTHLKVTMYPDGGIARLRAYGSICFDESLYGIEKTNVIATSTGARAVYANDEHFGKLQNILAEHEALNMADGWETRRRREPGNDWGVIELPCPAVISSVMVDTKFFKGNFPDTFSICADNLNATTDEALITQSMFWPELIGEQKLAMDQQHMFAQDYIKHKNPITHIRINIFPDGGISRLKLIGTFVKS
jgi:allantoicase